MEKQIKDFLDVVLNNAKYNKCYIINDLEIDVEGENNTCFQEIFKKSELVQQDDIVMMITNDSKKSYEEYYEVFSKLTLLCNENTFLINKGKKSFISSSLYKELMSLGFNLLTKFQENDSFLFFYAYNISKYKFIPDWLNNQNWANPKLWKK